MPTYFYPKRLTNLTAYKLNLWDVMYYLAARSGGRILISTSELVALTSIPRPKLLSLINDMLRSGHLTKDTGFLVDAPTGRHYAIRITNYPCAEPMVYKPAGYVTNGWLRVVRTAIPKRLLNYLLLYPDEPLSPENSSLGRALQAPWATHPVPRAAIRKAVAHLVELGLLTSIDDGRYLFHPECLDKLPLSASVDAGEQHPLFKAAYARDPLLAHRALALVRKYDLQLEQDLPFIFDLLGSIEDGRITWLQAALRKARFLSPEERRRSVLETINRRGNATHYSLFWPRLQREIWSITQMAMGKLRVGRLDPLVAAPRPEADTSFRLFLKGQTPGLALVGPMGTGKTTLLARWAVEATRQGHAALLLLASDLASIGHSYPRSFLDMLPPSHRTPIEEVLEHPGRECPEGVYLLILVDGLNETDDPAGLLQSLLKFLQQVGPAPLRLVLSCRDVSWRRLLHTVPFPFGLVQQVELGNFTSCELVNAYRVYQRHYAFSLSLDHVPDSVRTLLHHPLFLSFLARIWRQNNSISTPITVDRLIALYLRSVVVNQTAQQLLARTVRQMVQARSVSLPRRLVWAGDPDTEAAYETLIEAQILSEGWQQGEARVWFTYEQVGEYLLRRYALPRHPDRALILQVSEESREYPPLWRAMVQQLAAEADLELLEQWAGDRCQSLRAAVRDALVLRHSWGDEMVASCVERLVREGPASGAIVGLSVALERGLTEAMLSGIGRKEVAVREQATLHLYYLWRRLWRKREVRGTESAWSLLRLLARRAVGRFGIPHPSVMEALFWASALILTLHFDPASPGDLLPLLGLWRKLFRKVPLGIGRSSLRRAVLEVLVQIGGYALDSLLTTVPTSASRIQASRKSFEWSRRPEAEKQVLLDLMDQLERGKLFAHPDSVARQIIAWSEVIGKIEWAMALGIATLFFDVYPHQALTLFQKMVQYPVSSPVFLCATSAILWLGEEPGAYQKHLQHLSKKALEMAWEAAGTHARAASVNFAILFRQEIRSGKTKLEMPARLLAPAWTQDDPQAAVILIESLELTAVCGEPLPVLQEMALLFFNDPRPPVRTSLVQALTRLHVLYPEEVDYVLESAPADLRREVEMATPPSVLWFLVGSQVWNTAFRLRRTPGFIRFATGLVRQMILCNNWSEVKRKVGIYVLEWLLKSGDDGEKLA